MQTTTLYGLSSRDRPQTRWRYYIKKATLVNVLLTHHYIRFNAQDGLQIDASRSGERRDEVEAVTSGTLALPGQPAGSMLYTGVCGF